MTEIQSAASPPIRFRDDGPGAGQVLGALLLVVVLLAALLGAAVYARRRGWLERWIVDAARTPRGSGMRVMEVLRLSPRTRLYRVAIEGSECLVLESTATTASLQTRDEVARDAAV